MSRLCKTGGTLTASLLIVMLMAIAAPAAVVEGSSARAVGVSVRADLFDTGIINTDFGTMTKAPDAAAENPNDTSTALVSPIVIPPDDGSLVKEISALKVHAKRTSGDLPTAFAEAHTGHVFLFGMDPADPENAAIKLDAIDSVVSVKCTQAGKAPAIDTTGTRLIGLELAGNVILDETPEPNTVISLPSYGDPATTNDDMFLTVVLNEQTGHDAGTGKTVTAIHVIAKLMSNPGIVFADVKIATAEASAFCGDGVPPTNANTNGRSEVGGPATINKIVTSTTSDAAGATDGTKATAYRGDTVTWKITITNKGDRACGITQAVDTLPAHFSLVSVSGDLEAGGTIKPTIEGQQITWDNPAQYDLGPGKTFTETLVAKVASNAPFGTYTNALRLSGSCSDFNSGNVGPVDVIPRPQVLGKRVLPATEVAPEIATGELPRTGVGGPNIPLAAALMLGAGIGVRLLRRVW